MSTKRKKTTKKAGEADLLRSHAPVSTRTYLLFLVPVLAITFGIYLPALQNGFTNWDDILYVTQNTLLHTLDASGLKAIFSTPVVSNYHPLTILTLAVNYQFSELEPMTYHLTSILLHTINTGLVFAFIMALTSRNVWVSALVAILFGVHPMHVESVAWISERKDVLYTLFYLIACILYVRYVRTQKTGLIVLVTVAGILSLLSKPAAIVLPLSLMLIDYFLKRPWNAKWIYEKLPLFIASAGMAYATVVIQSKRAIASVTDHSILDRIFYAGFGWVEYLIKAIVPIHLSAFHPFPEKLTPAYYIFTIMAVGIVGFSLWKIRNRAYLFSLGFYTVNLLLVLQLVSIGNAVVAERYTYVPYIGLFFWMAMGAFTLVSRRDHLKWPVLGMAALWVIVLSMLTLQRIPVWKNSQTLWENVLKQYPESARAWTNKGLDHFEQKQWADAIWHLSKALIVDSTYANALEWRARTSIEVEEYERALIDAEKFFKYYPSEDSKYLLARSYVANKKSDLAIQLYTEMIEEYNKGEYYNNRGVIYFNHLKKYEEAKADFEIAVRLSPESGSYFLNLSRCYYATGDMNSARKFGQRAKELGAKADEAYSKLIGI